MDEITDNGFEEWVNNLPREVFVELLKLNLTTEQRYFFLREAYEEHLKSATCMDEKKGDDL